MISRFACLCLLVLSSAAIFSVRAQPPPAATPAATKPDDELVQIKLPDADIDTVLSALEIYTGRTILRPAALPTATYNLRFTRPMPKSEAILAIETVLALNGVGVAPLGDRFLKVIALQSARQEAPEMISGTALDQPASGKVATKVFQLDFMRVAEVVPLLQGILNPFYGGPVQLQNANAVLVTDSVSNLQRVEVLLQLLDKPNAAGMKPKFYQLRNGAKASDLVTKLRTILTGTLQIQLGQATSYSADDRTNQIVLVTDPRQYAFFDDLIERLDVKADPNTRNEVITLNHAKAVDVVNVLSKIISGQTSAIQRANSQSVRPGQGAAPPTPAAPGATPATLISSADATGGSGSNEFSSLMTVVNDDRSNSVVVSGTTDDIRLIRELIEKLDIILAQVRIEVVIAEVTLSDNDQSGISALGLKLDGDKLVGFSGTLGSPATLSVSNGVVTRPNGTNSVTRPWDLAAEISINTTPRKSNNTILSVPAIVTSHGKQAKFFNGETRPVVTGTVAAAGGVATGLSTSSTVAQQQIGTTLTVTPFIGVDGSVQLDIVQDVQDVIGTVQVDQNTQYIIGQRQTTAYVTARTGEIIVLGGFQKKTDTKSTSRLGPIPILGDLFGSRSKQKGHQEVIFFLRPTVLTNKQGIDNAETMRRVDELPTRDEIKKQLDPAYQPPKKSPLERILSK
ncbi:MAG: type II secretory pathway, component PulD [Opitutus sp.]|nr:type II secretory pathway, component PulD [Opitutus sp.]